MRAKITHHPAICHSFPWYDIMSRKKTRRQLCLFALFLAFVSTESTCDEATTQTYQGAFSFVFENDLFSGNDNNYTNGLSFNVTSAAVDTLGRKNFFVKTAKVFSFLPTVLDDRYQNFVGYRLTQEIYTPPDLSLPAPQPGEQPYAGVLLADVSLYSKTCRSQHTYIFAVGVVGPASGARETQELIHWWTESPEPKGWDTQLSNELLLNVGYLYDYRLFRQVKHGVNGFDISTGFGAGLGNYITNAQGSAIIRFGRDIPDTYGGFNIRTGSNTSVTLAPPPKKFRIYGSLGITIVAVAHFLPTDGNTFTDSYSGERDDFYASTAAGIVFAYQKFSLVFNYNRNFGATQRPGTTEKDYGSLSMMWFFE